MKTYKWDVNARVEFECEAIDESDAVDIFVDAIKNAEMSTANFLAITTDSCTPKEETI